MLVTVGPAGRAGEGLLNSTQKTQQRDLLNIPQSFKVPKIEQVPHVTELPRTRGFLQIHTRKRATAGISRWKEDEENSGGRSGVPVCGPKHKNILKPQGMIKW